MSEDKILSGGMEELSGEELLGFEASGGNWVKIGGYKYKIVLPSSKKCSSFVSGANPYSGKYDNSKHCGGCRELDKKAGYWICLASKIKA